jgi:hypothetical protein
LLHKARIHSFYLIDFHQIYILHFPYPIINWCKLSLFQFLGFMNSVAMNIGIRYLFGILIFVSFGYTPSSGLLDYLVI